MPKASQTPERVIRDKAFAKRLADAVESHPQAPSGHGRQSWLRERLESKYHSRFSAEALRKWFAGEARPKPKTMAQIAQILEVDEAWLSLGLKPGGGTPAEEKKRNAVADGVVNYVAGLIQLAGGTIAFPAGGDEGIDLFAIIKGQQLAIEVKLASSTEGSFRAIVNPKQDDHVLLVVVPIKPMSYDVVRVTSEVAKAGRRRGGYIELELTKNGASYNAGKAAVETVKSLEKLAA